MQRFLGCDSHRGEAGISKLCEVRNRFEDVYIPESFCCCLFIQTSLSSASLSSLIHSLDFLSSHLHHLSIAFSLRIFSSTTSSKLSFPISQSLQIYSSKMHAQFLFPILALATFASASPIEARGGIFSISPFTQQQLTPLSSQRCNLPQRRRFPDRRTPKELPLPSILQSAFRRRDRRFLYRREPRCLYPVRPFSLPPPLTPTIFPRQH